MVPDAFYQFFSPYNQTEANSETDPCDDGIKKIKFGGNEKRSEKL